MRVIYCFFLLLPACVSHGVRCDGRLQAINPPAPRVAVTAPDPPMGRVEP
jgi:hypothetical protein